VAAGAIDWVRGIGAAAAVGLVALSACSGPEPGRAEAGRGTPVGIFLPAADDAGTAPISIPPAAGQVTLRLGGEFGDLDQLTAELASVAAPDSARRWPVDTAPAGPDGARASLTVPAYALAPGEYIVTIWQGDAEPVRRYAFRVVP
jgi:hypothetical protein